MLLVLHSAAKLPDARETARTEHAAGALREHGAPNVETTTVGMALPRVDPREPGAAARNDRVEIVFVAPSASQLATLPLSRALSFRLAWKANGSRGPKPAPSRTTFHWTTGRRRANA